ncbi:MAG: LysR family transcriptional regulator [Myxococcota bacterium]|nr:LysR family transcriptional regulator [Myxococcota bacterium]
MDASSLETLDWRWLRDFAVVAEQGSLSAAARQLGLSQATLTRRMAALEAHLGSEVLRRTTRGVELSEVGEALLEPVRLMREQVEAVGIHATGRDAQLRGPVRISATEGLAVHFLTPALRDFSRSHPAIELQLDVRNRNANLLRREADIAVRLGRPRQPQLVARRVADLSLGIYGSRDYLARFPAPESVDDLERHAMIAFDDTIADTGVGRVAEDLLASGSVVFRSTSLLAQLAAIRAGLGLGMASDFIARDCPELVRVLPESVHRLSLWMVTHPGLRRSARIRAVYDFLVARFESERSRLMPEP